MPSLRLYCHRESGHSYKVALALCLMELPFETVAVDLNLPRERRPEDFREAARFGEVPTLLLNGEALCQSNAILDALARRFGKLDGHTIEEQHRVREWLSWEANRLGMSLPHLRFARKFTPYPAQVEAWFVERLQRDLDRLQAQLSAQEFVATEDYPTIADCSCAGYIYFAEQAQVDLAQWPAVAAWRQRLSEQPGFRAPYDVLPEGVAIAAGTRT